MIAAALACECPQTRLKQLRETGLGIGYGESSTGHKQRRADAKAMEEQMGELVDHDAVKHLERSEEGNESTGARRSEEGREEQQEREEREERGGARGLSRSERSE